MEKHDPLYMYYIDVLERELIPALGCTEPIAVAFCAAKARSLLGRLPQKVDVQVSGNIIKNVKSVIVPHTDGARGIEAAVAIGIVAGREEMKLQALSLVTEEDKIAFRRWLDKAEIGVRQANDGKLLSVSVTVEVDGHTATAKIADAHDRVIYLERDGKVLLDLKSQPEHIDEKADEELLTVEGICQFAEIADLNDVKAILDRQITYNTLIAEEGLSKNYGANIGKVLLNRGEDSLRNRAKAYAAAGSDARMNGCELPVVINSGSGNQGLTVSLPVIVYAQTLGVDQETLYRSLLVSNLSAIHIKRGIGCLSAYCGAVSAGAAAGAGIAWMQGGRFEEIAHTLVNALAISSGIVCDGAKASCAAKIAIAVETGIMGYEMFRMGQQFYGGDGIVTRGVENTIRNIGRLGRDGMRETDREILDIMTCVD